MGGDGVLGTIEFYKSQYEYQNVFYRAVVADEEVHLQGLAQLFAKKITR